MKTTTAELHRQSGHIRTAARVVKYRPSPAPEDPVRTSSAAETCVGTSLDAVGASEQHLPSTSAILRDKEVLLTHQRMPTGYSAASAIHALQLIASQCREVFCGEDS